jgi:hypothetical protein
MRLSPPFEDVPITTERAAMMPPCFRLRTALGGIVLAGLLCAPPVSARRGRSSESVLVNAKVLDIAAKELDISRILDIEVWPSASRVRWPIWAPR